MKRRNRIHLRATEKETAMLRELASDLDTTITGTVFDAVRFAYLHLDLVVAWNRTYKHKESDMSRLSDDEKRYFTDQISMLKNENERLTKYVEYSKDDKECMQNEIDVLRKRPAIKVSDGDVWLVFPDVMVSIEGVCGSGGPGPIVKRNLRKWREGILDEEDE